MSVAVGTGSLAPSGRDRELGTKTLTVLGGAAAGSRARPPAKVAEHRLVRHSPTAKRHPVLPPSQWCHPQTSSTRAADHSVNQFVGTYPGYIAGQSRVAQGSAFTKDDGTTPAGRRDRIDRGGGTLPGVDPSASRSRRRDAVHLVGLLAEREVPVQRPEQHAFAPSARGRFLTERRLNRSWCRRPAESVTRREEVTAILIRMGVTTAQPAVPDPNPSHLLENGPIPRRTFTLTCLGAVAASACSRRDRITNIMMVTVTERTREIGIRKALGAPKRTVLAQFLVEATVLSLLGGLLGVAAAIVGGRFTIAGVTPVIVPSSVALALGVSVAIGLFFGSYPASGRVLRPSKRFATNDREM